MAVKGIILDAFGTIIFPVNPPVNPYRVFENPDRRLLLTRNMTIADYAAHYKPETTQQALATARQDWDFEQTNYALCPEFDAFLDQCRDYNIRLCIGSNLATPYKTIVDRLAGAIPLKIYSCDIGFKKPEPAFFARCCDELNLPPNGVAMIGNSVSSDIQGAKNAALAGAFLRVKDEATAVPGVQVITKLTDIFKMPLDATGPRFF